MKKIIALLLVVVSILLLTACKNNEGETNTDPEKVANDFASNQAAIEEEYSKRAAEKAEEESKVQNEIDEYVKEIGKTKKKTQIVLEIVDWSLGRKYYKFEFTKKGEFKSRTTYVFYDSLENYYAELEAKNNDKTYKVIDKDKGMKMLVVKNTEFNGYEFEKMYEDYTSETAKEMGYKVIE